MNRKSLTLLALAVGALSFGCKSSGSDSEMVMSNEMCPMSGNAVDSSTYYEHEGTKIYTCCSDCATKIAENPEKAMKTAYGK